MWGRLATLAAAFALLSSPLEARADDGPIVVLPPSTQLQTRRIVDDWGVWESVCFAPCERSVPTGTYRIVGPSMTPSGRFRLEGTAPVWVVPRPRSWTQLGWGAGLTALGSVALLAGGVMAFSGTAMASQEPAGARTGTNLAISGWAIAGTGVVSLVIGILLLADGAHSGISLARTP